MKQLILCNWLFMKRSLKKFSFLGLIFLLPLLSYLFKYTVDRSEISVNVGIVMNDDSKVAKQIEKNLKTKYKSIHFYTCNSIDELKKNVANQNYKCGYVFNRNFSDKLKNRDLNGIVDLYKSPGALIPALSNEYIFSEIFAEYAYQELHYFLVEQKDFKMLDTQEFRDNLRKNYSSYLDSDDVFAFKFIDYNGDYLKDTSLIKSYLLFSVNGLISLFIMITAFIGTLNLYHDSKTGIFIAFHGVYKPLAKMSEIFSISVITGLSGYISLFICGLVHNGVTEFFIILLYCFISSIYCFILYRIISKPFIFCAMIPLLVIGSILFCPIFIDTSEIIPAAKYISWLFLPHYYFLL